MKTIGTFIVLTIIVVTLASASIDALNRSIYEGCAVIDQIGNTLIIELDSDLDATDTGCLKAERLIGHIMDDGYDVRIRVADGDWVAFPALREVR